jgi:hypothetical protein
VEKQIEESQSSGKDWILLENFEQVPISDKKFSDNFSSHF